MSDADILKAISRLTRAIRNENSRSRELLNNIVNEAIEHWPDAENWPIIEEAKEHLESYK